MEFHESMDRSSAPVESPNAMRVSALAAEPASAKEGKRRFLPEPRKFVNMLPRADRGHPSVVCFEQLEDAGTLFTMRVKTASGVRSQMTVKCGMQVIHTSRPSKTP